MKSLSKLLVLVIALMGSHDLASQVFLRQYGGNSHDIGTSVLITSVDELVVAGYSSSFGAGSTDIWMVKTDRVGDTIWSKTYGTTMADGSSVWGRTGPGLIESSDGGYLLASNNYGSIGNMDVYLIKTNSSGDLMWAKNIGGNGNEFAYSVIEKSNGNFVFAGFLDTMIVGQGMKEGMYVGEVDQNGNYLGGVVLGDTLFGGKAFSIDHATNGYVIAGTIPTWLAGTTDAACMVKLDSQMNIQWQVCLDSVYGGSVGYSVAQTWDGGYVMAGSIGLNSTDIFLLKCDANGTVLWTKIISTPFQDIPFQVIQNYSGLLIVGQSSGAGALVVQTYDTGTIIWSNFYLGQGAAAYGTTLPWQGVDNVICGSVVNGIQNDYFLMGTDSWGITCSSYTNAGAVQVDTILPIAARAVPISIGTVSDTTTAAVTTPSFAFTKICTGPIGITEPMAEWVEAYPNPFSDRLSIDIHTDFQGARRMEVFSVDGRKVRDMVTPAGDHFETDLSDLKGGMYLLRISEDGHAVKSVKISKRD